MTETHRFIEQDRAGQGAVGLEVETCRAETFSLGDGGIHLFAGSFTHAACCELRFGEIDKPVGGFGSREELYAGYEESGRKVDPARVKFWEVMGTLRWGVMCCGMMQRFRAEPDHSMERAMIGRRASESAVNNWARSTAGGVAATIASGPMSPLVA